jgi:hypothetical protein
LDGCERCESPTNEPAPVVGIQTAKEASGPWGEEERRLIDVGWEPKKRCGKLIWRHPDNGFYYSQEMAAHFLGSGIVTSGAKAGQAEGGNTTG